MTRSVFISHSSKDKPFVYKLAFELLAEGVPVWLDKWEFGPGDPLISSIEKGLDASALVLVVVSSDAKASSWVQREVSAALQAETRLGRNVIVPVTLEPSTELLELQGRVHVDFSDGQNYAEALRALVDRLGAMGIATAPPTRLVLPLLFHRGIELDTFVLDSIFSRWIGSESHRSTIRPECIQLVKSEEYAELQRGLRQRISTFMQQPASTSEGLRDLRRIDDDVTRRERRLQQNCALILRDFGFGFGMSNGHVIDLVRWYARLEMHYILCTLRAVRSEAVRSMTAFTEALAALPNGGSIDAAWWGIVDPVEMEIRYQNAEGRYYSAGKVVVPRTGIQASKGEIELYDGRQFSGAFEFDTLVSLVLPQVLHSGCQPAKWDQDCFRVRPPKHA